MPSGAYVKMDVHDWGMNVYSYAPTEDSGKTSGLCGTFDGDTSNDMIVQGGGGFRDTTAERADFIESCRYVHNYKPIPHCFCYIMIRAIPILSSQVLRNPLLLID